MTKPDKPTFGESLGQALRGEQAKGTSREATLAKGRLDDPGASTLKATLLSKLAEAAAKRDKPPAK